MESGSDQPTHLGVMQAKFYGSIYEKTSTAAIIVFYDMQQDPSKLFLQSWCLGSVSNGKSFCICINLDGFQKQLPF
ncbi:hypothetical protein ASL20_32545 [Cupriavidus necator]|nr:hypothetical protein ASL20_32545 [Cupriavidus necator]